MLNRCFVLLVAIALLSNCAPTGGRRGSSTGTPSGDAAVAAETAGDPCANGVEDDGESDVDCGGSCGPCANGATCTGDDDCESANCTAAYVCGAASCANGTRDGGESGVDCGGPCAACLDGSCQSHADCESAFCDEGTCAQPSCSDGDKNGSETGVDCGGADCDRCAEGGGCLTGEDCISGYCDGACKTPTCTDDALNQGESDLDCGGPCDGCPIGGVCEADADCASGRCTGGACVEVEATCDDGEKNGTESDADCGGGCPACPNSRFCGGHDDCLSATCVFGICETPTCTDGVHSGQESDTDCGGTCPGCADGLACQGDGDCESGRCTAGTCTSCADEVKSGGETGADCGGPCEPCGLGLGCDTGADCGSGHCEAGACCTPNACGECATTPEEVCDGVDNDCDGKTDEAGDIGAPPACPLQDGVCAGAVASCEGSAGWQCSAAVYSGLGPYQPGAETSCDGKDNDCDGEEDEGLTNACGECGSVPNEVCDGVDEDCDGVTDDGLNCAGCVASPAPVEVGESVAFQYHPTNFIAARGDEAYMLLHPYEDEVQLHRLADGQIAETMPTTIGTLAQASLVAEGLDLYVGSMTESGDAWHYEVSSSGSVTSSEVGESTDYPDYPAVPSTSAAGTWLLYTADWSSLIISKKGPDGWSYESWTVGVDAKDPDFIATDDGVLHVVYEGGFSSNRDLYYKRSNQAGVEKICSDGCGLPAMARGSSSKPLHIAYSDDQKVYYRWGKSGWSSPQTIDAGVHANVDVAEDGGQAVSYAKENDLYVAWRRPGQSAWSKKKVWDNPDPDVEIVSTGVALDSGGRFHLGFETKEWNDRFMWYVMACQ